MGAVSTVNLSSLPLLLGWVVLLVLAMSLRVRRLVRLLLVVPGPALLLPLLLVTLLLLVILLIFLVKFERLLGC